MTARGQRIRPGQVRADRHVLHGDPVRLPPDVLDLVAADAGAVGRALLQRRVRRRDRPLRLLHRPDCGRQLPGRRALLVTRSRPMWTTTPASRRRPHCWSRCAGCVGTNAPGFDGTSYLKDWPDGNTFLHPTAELFSSPLTGPFNYFNYSKAWRSRQTRPASRLPTRAGYATGPPEQAAQRSRRPTTVSRPRSIRSSRSRIPTGPAAAGGSSETSCPARPLTTSAGSASTARCSRKTYLIFGGGGATHSVINDYQQNLGTNPCPALRVKG